MVGLQELYRRLITGLGWVGPPIKQNRDGVPLAHDILERLGALSHSSQSGDEAAEGALNVPEQNSTTNGPRSINSSETNQCSPYEPVARTKICRNTFPTDPLQLSSLDEGTYLDTTASTDSNPFLCTFDYQDDFRWTTLPPETGNEMQFFNHYDTATLGTDIDFVSFDPNPLQQPIA